MLLISIIDEKYYNSYKFCITEGCMILKDLVETVRGIDNDVFLVYRLSSEEVASYGFGMTCSIPTRSYVTLNDGRKFPYIVISEGFWKVIKDNLLLKRWVFCHELGHYYDETARPNGTGRVLDKELAADNFAHSCCSNGSVEAIKLFNKMMENMTKALSGSTDNKAVFEQYMIKCGGEDAARSVIEKEINELLYRIANLNSLLENV